jgi:glycosyltransferase involved in cell wall biosynthesis
MIAAPVVAVGLAAGTWLMGRVRRVPPAPRAAIARSVSVIVPARDEQATLPHLLATLAEQSSPPAEVIVVDDGSTDSTAAIAVEAGAAVVAAPPPPHGWIGKPWACHLGAQAAQGDVLVFLDADVTLAPDGLARVLDAHAHSAADGMLSVQPFHVTVRPAEQLSAVCNVVSMMGSGAFAAGPDRNVAVAFGPCIVTTRSAYDAIGGHAAVASEVVEDIQLALAYRRAERPVSCLAGGTAVAFRMYPDGVRQLVEGWTKNLAAGARLAPPLATIGASMWVSAGIAVVVEVVCMLRRRPAKLVGWWPVAAWGVIAAQLAWILRRIGAFRWWASAVFPIPLGAFLLVFARSSWFRALRRPVRWRAREVPVARAGG